MLKILIGRSGSGKTTKVLNRICEMGQERLQILMVPEQQSHEMERALCTIGGSKVSLYGEVLSFTRLANRVFQLEGGMGEEELDAGGRLLLMYRALQSVSDQLVVYNRPSRRAAFLESLLATVDELKRCCVSPELLVTAGQDLGGTEGDKLRDLGLICGAYDALAANTALDPRDRLTRAEEKLKRSEWARGKDFWLDGFTDFTPQQQGVLRQLMIKAESVTVTLTCDHLEEDEGGSGIFSPARKTAAALIRLAKLAGITCEVEHLVGGSGHKNPALIHLEKNLFAHVPVEPVACQGGVELFRAKGPRSEVEWVASRILDLVRDENFRFREIGVSARNYGEYRSLIESVFERYGIPVFSSVMTDILEKPVLALVTAALESAAGDYAYEDMFRYLKTGLTDLPEEDRDILENYVLKWNIRGSRWSQSKDWTWHPRGYGRALEEEDAQVLERVNRARRLVIAPLEKIRKSGARTGRQQAMVLYDFMEEIRLPERLENRVEELENRGQPALADEYRQLWEILCGGLEQCASLLQDIPLELEEFAQLFRLVLSQYDVGSIPVSLDRVTAGETTRQTGHGVKVLFLLGADDASLPQVGQPAGLLSDDDRSILAGYGMELNDSSRELLYREMTTVYLTCTRPTHFLMVSWASQGPKGEERRPSFLAERLKLLYSDLAERTEESVGGCFRLNAPLPALEQAGRYPEVCSVLGRIPEYQEQIRRLTRAANWERGKLSRPAVDRLYGNRVPMSASRMDLYKSCHFSYFMRYGLKADPRKPAGFTAPEYGTFVHYVLEHVLQDEMFQQTSLPGMDQPFREEEKQRLKLRTQWAVERYVAEELGGLEGHSERFRYLFRRLLKSVHAVVQNVAEELRVSRFKPISFELGFGRKEDLPPVELTVDGVTISVSGFVDRVDGWVNDGKLYLRVVDYKTGRKTFDLTEIWNGLGLQMLLYLFALQDRGEQIYGLPVEGAGVLYLPARDAIVRGSRNMEDDIWRRAIDKELKRSGMVLDQPEVLEAMETAGEEGYRFLPLKVSKTTGEISGEALATAEQFGKLGRHIQTILEDICRELASGTISADPFWRGAEKNACRFCDYGAACHFEEGRGGDCRRWLSGLKHKEFWENMEQKK